MSATLWLLLQEEVGAVAPTGLVATLVAGPQVNLSWDITGIVSESGYSIERRDTTAGASFAEIDTVGANISVYEGDVGPFTAKHRYAWRIAVLGGPSDGEVSNEVALFGGTSMMRRIRRYGY